MKRLRMIIVFIFLSACAQNFQPTNTPTPKPSATKDNTPTPQPSPTIAPPFPSKIELPDWLDDPNATVGMFIADANPDSSITFMNADTQETAAIQIPAELVRGVFWISDGKYFGFLSKDKKTVFLVDITTGEVGSFPINENATKDIYDSEYNRPIEVITAIGVYPPNEDFLLLPWNEYGGYSFDGKYDIDYDVGTEYKGILIKSRQTAETVAKIPSLKDELHPYIYFTYRWSPVNTALFVLQGKESTIGYSSGDTLTIYNFQGQKLASFTGEFSQVRWSPNGLFLLYTESEIDEYGYKRYSNTPCILDIQDGERKCYKAVSNYYADAYRIGAFNLSRDGNTIYYIYEAKRNSGVCAYNRFTEETLCPTTDVAELLKGEEYPDSLNLLSYSTSPNEKFFFVTLGTGCFRDCDYGSTRSGLIVDRDGKTIINFGRNLQIISTFTWRPNIYP